MDTKIGLKVADILVKKLGLSESEITEDANFTKDLGIDSLDYAELTMEFEQAFDIRIPDSDSSHLATIVQAVNYIKKKIEAKN